MKMTNVPIQHCTAALEVLDNRMTCRIDPVDFFVWHSHDFWEFTVLLNGNTTHELNDEVFHLSPNDCLFISPKHLHYIHPTDTSFTAFNIVISCDFLKECCAVFSETLYTDFLNAPLKLFHLSNSQFTVINNFFLRLRMLSKADPQVLVIQKLLLNYVIEIIYNHYFIFSNDFPEVVKNFLQIATSPENIGMKASDIPLLTNYSYSRFFTIFKQSMGLTPNQYLQEQKMSYAYQQITKTDTPILDVSISLGFSSLSHFIKIFKKYYQYPPSHFRKKTHSPEGLK